MLRDPTRRGNKNASVSVNGETCWSKPRVKAGAQQCGGGYQDQRFRVTGCYATLSGATGM